MRRFLLPMVLCLGVIGGWQAWEASKTKAQDAGSTFDSAFNCSIAGVWKDTNSLGNTGFTSITPTDPTGKTFIVTNYLPEDPAFLSGFPDPDNPAVRRGPTTGIMRRVGKDTYRYTLKAVAKDALNQVSYTIILSGEIIQSECDTYTNRLTAVGIAPDGTVLFCIPITDQGERVRLESPCGDLPDFPE